MTQLQQGEGSEVRSNVMGTPFAANGQVDREHMYRYLAANDLLPTDVTREIEDTFIRVARRETMAVGRLEEAGLVAPLGSIGITQYEFERLNAMDAATQSMSIQDLGTEDRVEFDLDAVPVPVTRKGFRLDQRVTALGSQRGASVAQVHTEEATRQVMEKLEDSLTNGGDAVIGGNSMPGYTNFGARQTTSFNDVEWSATTDKTNAVDDVRDMKQLLTDNGYDGPYDLHIPSNWDTSVEDDYKAESDQTLRERILSITGVERLFVNKQLADSNAVLVQMTSDVVQKAEGQDVTTVTWDIHGGLAQRWLVMGVISFALKRADDGTGTLVSGIAHLS